MKRQQTKIYKSLDKACSKRISFVLATKNRAKFLARALENASKIVKKNDQLILIDGGSTDKTFEVVKKYSKFIDVFLSEADISPTHAANKGIMISQGKYIKLLTDDDFIYPQALRKAIQVLENNHEVEVMLCGGTVIHQDSKTRATSYIPPGKNYGKKIKDVFLYGGTGIGLIIRKSVFPKVGLFPLTYVSDVEFVVNCILKKVNVKFCRLKLYKATVYKHSVIMSKGKESSSEIYDLLKKHTPFSFYLKYRLNEFIWRTNWLNNLSLKVMNYIKQVSLKKSKIGSNEHIWDGGFS